MEVLSEYCGDYIIISHYTEQGRNDLYESPIWKALPAVQNSNVLEMSDAKLFFPDIYSKGVQLEMITDALLKLAAKE